MDMHVCAYERKYAENDVQKDENLSHHGEVRISLNCDRAVTLSTYLIVTVPQLSNRKKDQSPEHCRGLES